MAAVVDQVQALAGLPPGPGLSAALAAIDPAAVPNNWLRDLLSAQSRQAAHEAARQLAVIAEVGRANPTFDDDAVDRLDHPFRYAADEVRATLSWSRRAADRECDLAEQVVHELPMVFAAFCAGDLDRSKVWVFAEHLSGLTPEQIATVCAALVAKAGQLTPGQLGVRLHRMIIAVDPRHYERRYRRALRERTVCAWLDQDGTAVLSARGLSPEQAQAAVERIDLLAHAARRAGHRSTLDQIRVDVLAGLLDGTLHHLTRGQIIAHLIRNRSADDDVAVDGRDNTGPDNAGPDDTGPVRTGPDGTGAGAGPDGSTAISRADLSADDEPADDELADDEPADGTRAGADLVGERPVGEDYGDRGNGDRGNCDCGSADCGGAAAVVEDQRVGVEIRVALSTLLGHDQLPGEIPGLGPVPASHARDIVARQRRSEWRFAITDRDGRLVCDGITRRRPGGLAETGPAGGVVELQIPATTLPELSTGETASDPRLAGWTTVLADIARQYSTRDRRDLDAQPHRRLPHAALRRHTQIRDRSCVGVGCRRPPRRCDQDHTTAYQHGGETVAADLGPLCRHDHVLKTAAGWLLEQPEPGRFSWTTPLGGRYEVKPEPVLPPLPQPCPRPDDPQCDRPVDPGPETLAVWKPDPPRPPPAAPQPVDLDEPPF
jgi:Domain of unknown function (DUF222)